MSKGHFALLRRSGLIRQVVQYVYVDASVPDDTACRAAAVALVLPDGAALGRRTAAWLLGVDSWPLGAQHAEHPVESVVRRGDQPIRRPGVRCYEADLDDDDLTQVGSVVTTTALRTTADLLRWLPPNLGLGAADALAHRGLVDPLELVETLERWRKHPGITKARYLARLVEPATESFGESMLRLRIVDCGLPRPVVQIEICDVTGRVLWRLDLGWKERQKAAEYDGELYHSSAEQAQHDERRRESLRELGWQVYVARKEHVLGRGMELEWAVAGMLGMEPRTTKRRW